MYKGVSGVLHVWTKYPLFAFIFLCLTFFVHTLSTLSKYYLYLCSGHLRYVIWQTKNYSRQLSNS